jgi:putative phosphoesterase
MLLAIISDTHSRHATVAKVRTLLEEREIKTVIHCGDIEDAQTVRILDGLQVHYVLGNCDQDTPESRQAITAAGGQLHDGFGTLGLDGRKIAWTHGHMHSIFKDLTGSEDYDFLFYGHSHQAEQHRAGRTLIVNPGALHRARTKSFALLDTVSGKLETITVQS